MTFWTCSSVAECSITITMASSFPFRFPVLVRGQPLQPPALVDDPLEHALHAPLVQGARVLPRDALQDPRFALRRVDGQPQGALHLADLHRAGGPAVDQAEQLLVDHVDALSEPVYLALRALGRVGLRRTFQLALFSHRTCAPRSPSGLSSRKRTSALPTTTPSATSPADLNCSGVEIPNPMATGSSVWRFSRSTRGRASSDSACLSPVTPVRLIAYTKPREASATRRSRSSGLVGAARNTVSRSALRAAGSQPSASSGGRSVTSTPSRPDWRPSPARRSTPYCRIGFR